MAVIDGKPVPLADCSWVQTMACGCICTVSDAVCGDEVYATAQQIHEELRPLKRERDRDTKRGFTWALMTFEQYKARYGAGAWKCRHTQAQRYGKTPAAPPCHCGQPIPAGRVAFCSARCRNEDRAEHDATGGGS